MKKFTFIFSLLFCIAGFQMLGQNQIRLQQKSTTDYESGYSFVSEQGFSQINKFITPKIADNRDASINWQLSDEFAIGSKVKVSSETGRTFMEWSLNDKRISMYGNSSVPEWENMIDTEWEWPIDMTTNGQWSASSHDGVVQVFNSNSSEVYWETIVNGTVIGTGLSPDGSKIFIARNFAGKSYVSAFTVGQNDPEWETVFVGDGTVFTSSEDGSKLVFCQYGGANTMWVIDGTNGDIIFNAIYKNQNAPGISNNGNIIVNGDYSGNVHLYEFDEPNNTYVEKWNYKVGGGGTSVWTVGLGVSGDGSTVAVGTLIFTSAGGFDGEI